MYDDYFIFSALFAVSMMGFLAWFAYGAFSVMRILREMPVREAMVVEIDGFFMFDIANAGIKEAYYDKIGEKRNRHTIKEGEMCDVLWSDKFEKYQYRVFYPSVVLAEDFDKAYARAKRSILAISIIFSSAIALDFLVCFMRTM